MRSAPRYPARIDCFLVSADGSVREGLLLDISAGGVGVETDSFDAATDFGLMILSGGEQVCLPCSVRHVRDLWSKKVIHAAFTGLTAEQQEAVERLIESLIEPDTSAEGARWWREVLRRALRDRAA